MLPEGEGEVLPEGEGEVLPEGEGEVLPEGEGEVPRSAINVTKTADIESFSSVGEVITYTIVVTNTGSTSIANIRVKDPLTGLDAFINILTPGESRTFTQTYAVTEQDLEAGTLNNVVSVSALGPDGETLEDNDERIVPEENPCCNGVDLLDPANLFLGALALIALVLLSLFLGGGGDTIIKNPW